MKTAELIANRQTRPLLRDPVVKSDADAAVRAANRWRDQYNPLRGLTLSQAICLLETYKRGEFTDLMWLYFHIEETDEDLIGLVENRTGAIVEMDYDIKLPPPAKRRKDFDQTLADEQAEFLRKVYDGIDNLYDGIEHLAMATFRGFAHLEKHDKGGHVGHLEPLDQWNVVRDGMKGPWKYNPEARSASYYTLPEDHELDPAMWIIRDRQRHIDRIALIKFIRMNLGMKDWTAFVEVYGIPQPTVILPPSIPSGQDTAYRDAAQSIANGQPGALPNGSDIKYPTEVRGQNPFAQYLDYLTRRMILAGTGGMLTMLNDATGLGSGQSDSHRETFKILASKEARQINGLLQRSIDAVELAKEFPGKPALAYFELAFNEETDTGQVVDEIGKLSTAGYQVEPGEVTEKTGYTVEIKTPPPLFGAPAPGREPPGRSPDDPDPDLDDPARLPAEPAKADEEGDPGPGAMRNRRVDPQALADASREEMLRAVAADLAPLRERLAAILQIGDRGIMETKLREFLSDLERIKHDINADPAQARVLEQLMASALANGIEETHP